MASTSGLVYLLPLLALLPFLVSGDTCLDPKVKPNVYTTTDSSMATQSVVIIEFSVDCKNSLRNVNLYAELNGRTLPVSQVEGTSNYQVSFSDEHKKLSPGLYNVRFFDEEGYADLRKAQRSGEDTSSIKSLFTVPVNHDGASRGPGVQSEFVAASVAILVWYLAYNARSKLQA